jgi:hypothetical protein
MPRAQLIITAVVVEDRSKTEVARDYSLAARPGRAVAAWDQIPRCCPVVIPCRTLV